MDHPADCRSDLPPPGRVSEIVGRAAELYNRSLVEGTAGRELLRHPGLVRFCRHCAANGIARVQDITLPFLEGYRGEMRRRNLADATVEQYLRAPRLLLASIERRGEIFESPARRMALYRRPLLLPRVPDEIQVLRLLAQPAEDTAVGKRDRALLEFLYSTGARVAEALSTDNRHRHPPDAPAEPSGRMTPMPADLLQLLEEHLERLRSLNSSPTTVRSRSYSVREFLRWLAAAHGVASVERLTSEHLRSWQLALARHRTSRGELLRLRAANKKIEGVRRFLDDLHGRGYLGAAPAAALQYVKEPKLLPRALQHEQMRMLLQGVDTTGAAKVTATAPCWSCSTAAACARPNCWGWTWTAWTSGIRS